MIESEIDDIPQLSEEENRILTAGFNEKEVHYEIMQTEKNKTPGPDGFLAEFYQRFWKIIKSDLMSMFLAFQRGELPLFHLNFGTIILLPQKENAIQIQQYRPICLLNISSKIFTKMGTNRISEVAHAVVRPTQTAFMPGRHILEGVVFLHETIHELHRKKLDGVLLKIDFEKAYDKVKWNFLQQDLRMKVFDPKWCKWIQEFISCGSVGYWALLSNEKGVTSRRSSISYFIQHCYDILSIMINRAKEDGQVSGLIPHLVYGGVSVLQYADDTIIFLEHDLENL
jgi:hypothetical protein